jgi:hypothetical protein
MQAIYSSICKVRSAARRGACRMHSRDVDGVKVTSHLRLQPRQTSLGRKSLLAVFARASGSPEAWQEVRTGGPCSGIFGWRQVCGSEQFTARQTREKLISPSSDSTDQPTTPSLSHPTVLDSYPVSQAHHVASTKVLLRRMSHPTVQVDSHLHHAKFVKMSWNNCYDT